MSTRAKFPVDLAGIRDQLHKILSSAQFRNSKRCSDFLKQVVEGATEGRLDSLKERSLGISVFDREPDYDTNQDPIVRNTAGQVRKRLAQYYHEPGREGELRIDLPPGSYVPEISAPVAASAAVIEPEVIEKQKAQPWKWIAVGLCAAIVVAAAFWLFPRKDSPLDRFWAPLLKYPGSVVLCVGQGHTYKLTPELDQYYENGQRLPDGKRLDSIPLSDVIPAWDRYVALSDSRSVMRLSVLFTRFGKDVALRGGRSTTLADLRGKPVVLVGAFNNDWTLRLTGELRFYFEYDPERKVEVLKDREHPENRYWQVQTDAASPQIETDYAIVTRVHNPTTEQMVVVAAGIRGGGTSAASEFLTNPAYITQALRSAPSGWESKNIQFVLSTKMFSGNPGPPAVVAAHYW